MDSRFRGNDGEEGPGINGDEHLAEWLSYVPLADPAAMSEVHVVKRRDDRSPLVAQFVRLLLAGAR